MTIYNYLTHIDLDMVLFLKAEMFKSWTFIFFIMLLTLYFCIDSSSICFAVYALSILICCISSQVCPSLGLWEGSLYNSPHSMWVVLGSKSVNSARQTPYHLDLLNPNPSPIRLAKFSYTFKSSGILHLQSNQLSLLNPNLAMGR